MSIQPRYKFDPVTQRYTLLNPQEIAQRNVQEQGGIRSFDSYPSYPSYPESGGDAAPAPDGSYSMSPETAVGMQNFGLAMQGVPTIGAQVVGSVVGGIPSAYGYATPTPVDNPVAPVETAIAPTMGLAAMNAQVAAEDEAETQAAQVANIASAISDVATQNAAQQAQASPEAAVAAAAPADVGVSDVGGSAMGDSGAGVGDVGGGGSSDGGGGGDGGGDSGSSSSSGGGTDTGAADSGWRRGGYVMNYEQGGVASLANKVQEKGRGEDKMLVHMTPKEVAGLQYLAMRHGGSLTVNPETGLVEAGFLKNILPMVAGAALAATGVGAPMAALLVGGGYGLATGSLEKGLMAGLGAFGGAGLAGSLSAAGAGAGAGLNAPTVTGTTQGLAAQGASGAAAAPSYALTSGTGAASGMGLGSGLKTAAAAPGFAPTLAPATQVAGAITPSAAPVTFSNMGAGIKALGTEAGRSQFLTASGGPMGLATKAGAAAAPMLASSLEGPPSAEGKVYQPNIRPFKFDAGSASQDPNFRFRTGERGESTAEQRYLSNQFTPVGVFKPGAEPAYGTYKAGGIASLREGDFILPADVISHMGNGSSDAGMEIAITQFKARPIKGDGDGMSDSIPTDIEGKQKALVAHEEAQIPREMVAFLGGGSVEKGAAKLEKFMDRVRKARTGKTKQAPEIDVSRYIPA